MSLFKDRVEAGELLAKALLQYKNRKDVLVLALPRGGVPVGFQVAKALRVDLDVFLVRKLGVPFHEELAMGAITSGGMTVLNEDILQMISLPAHAIEEVRARELTMLNQREKLYRGSRTFPDIQNKIIIIVDDGIATGATMRAAIQVLKQKQYKKIVVATPVAPSETYELLQLEVDEVICLQKPDPFFAIGLWYQNFSQTSDEEVQNLLAEANAFKKEEDE